MYFEGADALARPIFTFLGMVLIIRLTNFSGINSKATKNVFLHQYILFQTHFSHWRSFDSRSLVEFCH